MRVRAAWLWWSFEMRWARIDDDCAVEVIDFNPAGAFHPSLVWEVVPDDVTPGSLRSAEGVWFPALVVSLPPEPVYAAPTMIVPEVVGSGQMMVALDGMGLLDAAEAWVAQQPRYVQLAWQRVSEFRRDSVLINEGAAALGWDAVLLDSVFQTAALVEI